jgi:hypothetical protein
MMDGEAHLTRWRTARGACWRRQAARRAFEAGVRESCRGGSGALYLSAVQNGAGSALAGPDDRETRESRRPSVKTRCPLCLRTWRRPQRRRSSSTKSLSNNPDAC